MTKLSQKKPDKAVEIFLKVLHFKQRRLNVTGSISIFIDLHSFLHIYLRHVEEMKINKHFEHKDNFQWDEEDVISVMQHVIRSIDDEIQKLFKENPRKRYSRFGKSSLYFEGDYYTVHIEPDGRISTFYKNRKEHDERD